VIAGGGALVALSVGAIAFAQTPVASRVADGVGEVRRETGDDAARVVVSVPASLGVRRGGLVYRENADGSGDIVGRVVDLADPVGDTQEITLLLTPAASGMLAGGGKVRGAAPTLTVENAFRLMISPSIPREEAAIARDMLWPAIQQHVGPGLKERITKELTHSMNDLAPEDRDLLNATVADLRKEVGPLEEQLLNKLANRAWEVIGVSGVAEGVVRKAADCATNTFEDA
jgi:hypothetical protein